MTSSTPSERVDPSHAVRDRHRPSGAPRRRPTRVSTPSSVSSTSTKHASSERAQPVLLEDAALPRPGPVPRSRDRLVDQDWHSRAGLGTGLRPRPAETASPRGRSQRRPGAVGLVGVELQPCGEVRGGLRRSEGAREAAPARSAPAGRRRSTARTSRDGAAPAPDAQSAGCHGVRASAAGRRRPWTHERRRPPRGPSTPRSTGSAVPPASQAVGACHPVGQPTASRPASRQLPRADRLLGETRDPDGSASPELPAATAAVEERRRPRPPRPPAGSGELRARRLPLPSRTDPVQRQQRLVREWTPLWVTRADSRIGYRSPRARPRGPRDTRPALPATPDQVARAPAPPRTGPRSWSGRRKSTIQPVDQQRAGQRRPRRRPSSRRGRLQARPGQRSPSWSTASDPGQRDAGALSDLSGPRHGPPTPDVPPLTKKSRTARPELAGDDASGGRRPRRARRRHRRPRSNSAEALDRDRRVRRGPVRGEADEPDDVHPRQHARRGRRDVLEATPRPADGRR